MGLLHLYDSEPALEDAIDRLLQADVRRSALEVGAGITSIPRLLAEAKPARAEIGRLGESLVLVTLAGAHGALAPRTALQLRRSLSDLRRAAVSSSLLHVIARKIVGSGSDRARKLAGWLERYEAQLGDRYDGARLEREALRSLARDPLPCLAEIDAVVVHAAPLEPIVRAVTEALIERGLVVRCEVPELDVAPENGVAAVYSDRLADAASSALDSLESIESPGLERSAMPCGPGPRAEIVSAGSPLLEARELARLVRDWVHEGHPPDDVTIVADLPARRREIVDALRRYGLPVDAGRDDALDSEAVRLVPALLALADEDVPRDRFVDLVASRYVAGALHPIRAGAIVRAIRELVPASARAADYRPAFAAWAKSESAERRAIAARVGSLVDAVMELPARATLARHVAVLRRLLERLQLFATTPARSLPPGPEDRAQHALARDRAALRRLEDLLEAIPRAATRAGLADRAYDRGELVAILVDELNATSLPTGGARGAAVRVCTPRELVARRDGFLLLASAEEDSLPASGDDDPFSPDDLRLPVERALDRRIFSSAIARERSAVLGIALARSLAARLVVSWSRGDADGKPLLPGALVIHARATCLHERRTALQPIPRLADARIFDELAARSALERHGDEGAREGLGQKTLLALDARLARTDETRFARVRHLASIERGRAEFFSRRCPAGPWDGFVPSPPLNALLGSATRPLSASTLGRYAECPQRFFLESVLRLRAAEELGDDLDERAMGSLAHAALERVFTAWRDAEMFPLRGLPAEQALIPRAVADAAASFGARQPSGHEALFRGRLRTLERLLEAIWRNEIASTTGLRPVEFERSFSGLSLPSDDGEPIHLTGAIDRIDAAEDRVAVFDYKSGRLQTLSGELDPEAFGDTSWQLPLYAAAVRATRNVSDVSVHFYSLRDVETRGLVAPASLVFDRGSEAAPTLGDRTRSIVRAMRAGHFEVEPREGACEYCRMQPACRIRQRHDDDEVLA